MSRTLKTTFAACAVAAAFAGLAAPVHAANTLSALSNDDLRARCEMLTGNGRLDCMQELEGRRSGMRTPQTTAEIRAEAREAVASPAARCEASTSNRRLDCLQQYRRMN